MTARRIAAISGAIIVVALLAVAAFHSRPARARVLAAAIAWLARTGYVARVGAVDYNLLTLTVHLSDVTLATSSTPFFSAKEVHASFPSRILFGRIDIERVEIVAPRITLLRDADGRDNWTTGANQPATAPPRIRIGRARVSDLVLIWNDEQTSTHLEAGGSLELTPDGRDISGPITLSRPALVGWRDRETRVDTLAGRVSWNDRDLSLHAVSLRAPEGTVRVDGRIESLLGDPRIDVRIGSDVDVAAISRWVTSDRAIAGTARGDVHVAGPLASPDLELTSMTAEIAGGSVTANGRASVDGPGAVRVEWKHLDLPALVKGAIGYTHRAIPAERLSGSLDAKWTAPRLDQLHLTAESRAIDTRGDPAGSSKLELRGTQFALSAEELVALGVRAGGKVQGTLNTDAPAHSPIRGSIDVQARDAANLTQALVQSGLIRTRPPIRGTAAGAFVVSGTLGAPSLEGSLDAALQYASVPSTALRARASISPREIGLSDIDARLAGSFARGAVRWTIDSGEIDGTLSGSLKLENLRDLTAALPRTLPLAGTLDLSAALSGSLAQPRIAMSGAGRALDVAGQRIDRLTAGARLTGSELAVDRLLLEIGTGRLDAAGTFDLTRETYAARATAVNVPIHPVVGVAGDEPLPISGSLSGNFDGQGSFRHLGGRGRLSLVDTRWRDADLGRIGSELTLAGRDVTFTFDAGDLALKGSGAVSLDPNGPVSLRGRWEPDDLAALARRLTIAVPLSSPGSASAGFELTGTRDRLADAHGVVTVDRVDVDIAEQAIRLARPGRIESDGRIVRVDDIALATGSSNLTVTGSIGESAARELTLTLDGSVSDFWFVRDLIQPRSTEAARLTPPAGSIRARVTAAGTLEQPRIAGSFQIAAGRIPLTDRASVTDIEVAAKYDDGVVTVERATAAFEGATLLASARVPSNVFLDRVPTAVRRLVTPAAGPAVLSAQIRSITRSIAAPFVDAETLEQIALQADASIDLESDRLALDRVRGTVTLGRAEISLAGVSFDQQTTTRLVVGEGRVTVDAWNWGRDDNRVALRGGVTLGEDFALNLVATSALDLRSLNALTPAAQVLGRADAELRLGGTVRAPTIDGYVTLSNGEARIANPRLIIGDITGTITLAADRLTLERLYATVNGGGAELAGSIRHVWLTPLDGRVTFSASGSSFDLTGLRAEGDAALRWTLDSSGPALDGTVTLLRSAYREPLSLTGGLLNALRLSTATPVQPGSPSIVDRTRLDVRLVTADDLIVDNNLARLTLRSDLRVVGTVSRPSVTGRATLGEGGVLFFGGNRYRLSDQGSIDFANPNQIEPDLDVSAVTRVQGNEITLTLRGTPATLETSLKSDNKQQSQAEIVSLLLIGRTTDRGVGTASGGPGGNDLLGLLTGELVGAAGRAVGLDTVRLERGTPDVVRFDAGLVAAETNPGARLTFGKTIGSKAEVVFSQSLQQSGGLTWIVSYAPRSGIGLRAVSLDDGDRLYEFTHDLTFGGGKRPARNAQVPAMRISDVTFTIDGGAGADEPALRERLKLRAGDRFSFFQWQDDRERLERFYHERQHLEARIVTRRVVEPSDATRVHLTYEVREGPRTTLVVDGFSLSRSTMAAIERAWSRAVVDDFLREEVATLARAQLADEGFVLPSVTPRVERQGDAKQLRVTIEAGQRAGDRRVEFSGNAQERSERLRQVLAERDLERAVWIEPDRVRDALESFYHSNGYLKAAVRVEPVSIAGGTAVRPIHVDEGEAFRIRTVRLEGVRAITPEEAARIVALWAGDRFTEPRIEEAQLALDRHYRARGFNRVSIVHQVEMASSAGKVDEVDVAIRVDEGAQQRLRDIVTTGLERTDAALVSRALKLDVGEPVDLAAWNAARRRLYETGAFRSVDVQREVIAPAAPVSNVSNVSNVGDSEPVRAIVTVQEWPRLRLRYGLEVQDELQAAGDAARANAPSGEGDGGRTFGLGAAGDLSARNLFGRAVSAGVAGRYTLDTRAGRIYATAPSFFGLPITSNVFLERSRERVGAAPRSGLSTFEVQTTDLTVEQRLRPARRTEISYGITRERNHTFRLDPDPTDPLPFDITITTGKFISAIAIDTRDDLIDPSRGWFHSSSLAYAPEAISADVRFARYFLQQHFYRRTGRILFATSVRLGLATAFDQSLIPAERFFAGGGNSVRGYAEDVLTPLDFGGDAIGGQALAVFNQEVRFPMFKLVRGVAFFDAGRAFDQVSHLSLGDLSTSTGFGLRVQTPFVLLRVDLGIPFDTAPGPRRARLFFSIGQMF